MVGRLYLQKRANKIYAFIKECWRLMHPELLSKEAEDYIRECGGVEQGLKDGKLTAQTYR
jgi:hypothetical protein